MYNGTLVIKQDFAPSSFQIFDTIFLKDNKDEVDMDVVKHEWGHWIQENIIGDQAYITGIAIPSLITNFFTDLNGSGYYSLPWELTADTFGGVEREDGYYVFGSEKAAQEYFDILGNDIVGFILNMLI